MAATLLEPSAVNQLTLVNLPRSGKHDAVPASPHGEVALLWIDDDVDSSLTALLAFDGFRVTEAATGHIGLSLASCRTFDIIVVDLHLPDFHGLTVLQTLAASVAHVPLLAVTGHYLGEESRRYALAAGAKDLAFKPLWYDSIAPLLKRLHAKPLDGADNVTTAAAPHDLAVAEAIAHIRYLRTRGNDENDVAAVNGAILKLVQTLRDPRLTLGGFAGSAKALRSLFLQTRTGSVDFVQAAIDELRIADENPLIPRHPVVCNLLRELVMDARWRPADELASRCGLSRGQMWRLVIADLGIDYRALREVVVMKAAATILLSNEEYVSQVAHGLQLHPGSLDRKFRRLFGVSPQLLRKWARCVERTVKKTQQ